MRESPSKRVARAIFYEEFLPGCLPRALLRSAHYVLLLGRDGRELSNLDAIGVPRSHIWSVERDPATYFAQIDAHWGVSLYCGELETFLAHLLHTNQDFLVLNLDIEGSYLRQIDPAMGSTLLFAWRNPQTVIATYSSIGRDDPTILEGIRSLGLFLAVAPKETERWLEQSLGRYASIHCELPLYMACRDLFWLRSHAEYIAAATAAAGLTSHRALDAMLRIEDEVFRDIQQIGCPLRLDDVRACADRRRQSNAAMLRRQYQPRLGVQFERMHHLVYRARPPWSQRCYFSQFTSVVEPLPPLSRWLAKALTVFGNAPLVYIDRQGNRSDMRFNPGRATAEPQAAIWSDTNRLRSYRPRTLPSLVTTHMTETIRLVRKRYRTMRRNVGPKQPTQETHAMASHRNRTVRTTYTRAGKLTEAGKTFVRQLARLGYSTEAILRKVPGAAPTTIRAYVAIAHRGRRRS